MDNGWSNTGTMSSLCTPDILVHILPHLTRQDGLRLSLTCSQAAASYRALQPGSSTARLLMMQYTPVPRVVICASGSQKLLVLPLTPEGQPYMQPGLQGRRVSSRTRPQQLARQATVCPLQAVVDARASSGHKQWLTSLALSPYDNALYVSAYGTEAAADTEAAPAAAAAGAPAAEAAAEAAPSGTGLLQGTGFPPRQQQAPRSAIQRFTHGSLRFTGCLVSGPAVACPEGLVFAKHTCYVACCNTATLVALGLPDRAIQQTLQLEDEVGCPWGMAAWDPCTYPQHALAAQHISKQQQQESHQQKLQAGDDHSGAPVSNSFAASAAQGCLFVAVQEDVHRDAYWEPPEGPASGGLLCVPLDQGGRMLCCKQWSQAGIKRPSGVTIDHAGHVWTTSLERLLLRFAGPAHAHSGCLLQQVSLVQLLPDFASSLFPMDVQAYVQEQQGAASAAAAAAAAGAAAVGGCLLIVTVHAGPSRRGGAVAVLSAREAGQGQAPAAARVCLVNCWQDSRMSQPNMVAIL